MNTNASFLSKMAKSFGLLALALLIASSAIAQKQRSGKSPMDVARLSQNGVYTKITYSQPSKKGRDIFGGLVPYGQVWRTGANETTELSTTGDITIGGNKLGKGTYAVYAIPGANEWTIVLNSKVGTWGHFQYDESQDLFRIKVKPNKRASGEELEKFFIWFDAPEGGSPSIRMAWDDTEVAIPISHG